jgi:adenosylcobinamide-GDP ribazoletransferase
VTGATGGGRGRGARGAIGLLTVVGGPSSADPRSVPWFPVVGGGLGAVLGVLWWALDQILPSSAAAAGVVAADLALTGMLHLDGWIDSADGLLAHLERERRLVVMSEPQVGAFGVGSAAVLIALRVTALGSVPSVSLFRRVLLLAGLWATSRALMGLATVHLPYAREAGMVSAFGGNHTGTVSAYGANQTVRRTRSPFSPTLACVLAMVGAAAGLVGWRPRAAPAVLGCGLAAGAGVLALGRRKLGGYTGDVLGAAGLAVETAGLVVAAGKW